MKNYAGINSVEFLPYYFTVVYLVRTYISLPASVLALIVAALLPLMLFSFLAYLKARKLL